MNYLDWMRIAIRIGFRRFNVPLLFCYGRFGDKVRKLSSGLIFICFAWCVPAFGENTSPTLCQAAPARFSLLDGKDGSPVVGAEMNVGVYSDDMTVDKVASLLKDLPTEQSLNNPEWLIVQEYRYRKEGNVAAIAAMYNDSAGADYVSKSYRNAAAMRQYANRVSKIKFDYRAEYGPVVQIAYTQYTSPTAQRGVTWHMQMVKTALGYRILAPYPSDVASTLASFYPYWNDANKLKFGVDVKASSIELKTVSIAASQTNAPPVKLLVRSSSPDSASDFLKRIIPVYQAGTDEEVVNLFDRESQVDYQKFILTLAGAKELRLLRLFLKVNPNPTISFVIAGSLVTYIGIRAPGANVGEKNHLIRCVPTGTDFKLTLKQIDESTTVDALLTHNPEMVNAVAAAVSGQKDVVVELPPQTSTPSP